MWLAVVLSQVEQGLAFKGILSLDAASLPLGDKAVRLGRKIFQQSDELFAFILLVLPAEVSREGWNDGVDDNDLQGLCSNARSAEELAEMLDRELAAAFGQEVRMLIHNAGKCFETNHRRGVWADSAEFPYMTL